MPNALYKASVGSPPLASDLNQIIDALNGGFDVGQITFAASLTAPNVAAVTSSFTDQTGLNRGIGTYKYRLTYVTGYIKSDKSVVISNETDGSASITVTTTSTIQVINLNSLPTTWPATAVQMKIYRTAVGGAVGSERLVAVLTAPSATYADSMVDAALGAPIPTTNTTGTSIPVSNLTGVVDLTSGQVISGSKTLTGVTSVGNAVAPNLQLKPSTASPLAGSFTFGDGSGWSTKFTTRATTPIDVLSLKDNGEVKTKNITVDDGYGSMNFGVNNQNINNIGYMIKSTNDFYIANHANTVGLLVLKDNGDTTITGAFQASNYKSADAGVNADLNALTTSGFYRLESGIVNGPGGVDYGQMIVAHGGGDTIFQMATGYSGDAVYTRQGNPTNTGGSGTYQPWRKLWHDNMLRVTNGILEYFDGTVWREAGMRRAVARPLLTGSFTWSTAQQKVVNVTGAGTIHQIVLTMSPTDNAEHTKLVVDGQLIQPDTSWTGTQALLTQQGWGFGNPSSQDFPMNINFKSSFEIWVWSTSVNNYGGGYTVRYSTE